MGAKPSDRRLHALDNARGIAMLGVFVAHFGVGIEERWRSVAAVLRRIGMFASPTFVLLSGTVVGYLLATSPSRAAVRAKLMDRGAFLILFGHVIVLGAHVTRVHQARDLLRYQFMTDTIACALIVAAVLPTLSVAWRGILAGVAYTFAWLVAWFWNPQSFVLEVVKDAVFGSLERGEFGQSFPLLPWFAVFLVGTVLGDELAAQRSVERRRSFVVKLLVSSALALAASGALKMAYRALRPNDWHLWKQTTDMPPVWLALYSLTSPFNKYPPGPGYLLFFGGIGGALIAGCLTAEERGWLKKLSAWNAVIGRASLVVFVAQFYVFYVLVPALPQPSVWILVAYAVSSTAMLWLVANAWLLRRGNRLLTVGLTRRTKVTPAR
jgi:uncharacterized membrane protein